MTIYSAYINENNVRRFKFFHSWDEYYEFFFNPEKFILKTKVFEGKEVK